MVHSDGSVFAPLPAPPRGQRSTRGKARDSRVRGLHPYSRPVSIASTRPPSSSFQSAQGSPVSVHMVLDPLDPLIGPQGNTYVGGVPTDDLTQELDRRADLVYAEVVEERNREEMARYADSGPESD